MADIRDPRILWTKWGLFIVLGSLASAILLLEANSLTAALMLAIAVWAFCRAYYFAFYGIEKYVDPNFKYAGIYSLIEYWIAKSSNKPSIHRSGLMDIESSVNSDSNKHLVYLDLAKWFLVALLANLIVPMLFGIWSGNRLWPLYLLDSNLSELMIWCLLSILLGFACVEVALASIFGALFDAPAKNRLPLPIAATYILTIAYLIGLHGADVIQLSKPDVHVMALIMAGGVVSTIIGIVLLLVYRRWSHSVLGFKTQNMNEARGNNRSQERQFGIQYLLVATTIIAIGIAVARAFRILSLDFLDRQFLVAFFAGLITLLFAVIITLLCIEMIFRNTTQRGFRTRLMSLLFSLASFPAIIIQLCEAIPGNLGDGDTLSYVMLYTFFASYCGLLLWIGFQFRKRGLRLLTINNSKIPFTPHPSFNEDTEN